MNSFIRSILALMFIAALTVTAVGQIHWSAPGTNGLLRDVYIYHMDRTVLGEDIVHYRFNVVVGSGKYDRIQLHRIVRERHPWQPVHTTTGLLMLPGGPNSVEMIFMEPLISSVPAWDRSITVFLAKSNIDVWAMDYRWALVPPGTTDFRFMKTWGLQRDVDDTKIALSLARMIRGATGQGFGQLNLFGFSYGTWVGYSVVNQETQRPHALRNVKGLIPVDAGIAFAADEPFRKLMCDFIPQDRALFDAGTYTYDNTGAKQLADLARSDPSGASGVEGFNNSQLAMFVGASVTYPPSWHFVAGVFNDDGVTTDLQYTNPLLWIDVLGAIPPYNPVRGGIDQDKVTCYDVVPPFNDHLKEVTLPILYIGAAGGFGERGFYAVTLTSSSDVTKHIVQLHPDAEPELDFGHADLFAASNAAALAWQPILDWLSAHK